MRSMRLALTDGRLHGRPGESRHGSRPPRRRPVDRVFGVQPGYPGSPELSEATRDLVCEVAVDLTQRIDQLDVVPAFDEVESGFVVSVLTRIRAVPAAPGSVSTSPLAVGVVVGLTSG